MNDEANSILFGTPAYAELAGKVGRLASLEAGILERESFPDGERGLRIKSSVAGRECVLLGGTGSDTDTLEVYDLACGLVAAGARTLTFLVPYFGYGTADHAALPGEVVTAKTRALLLSSVPQAAAGNRIFVLDAHAEGLPYYFEGNLRAFHLYGEPVIIPAIRELGGNDFILATVDSGRAKWVSHFADVLGVETAIVLKRRLGGRRTDVVAVSAPVAGRRVIIYDDMIRSGGSLLGAARAYLEAGAASVAAVATHGVLPGDALERLATAGLLECVVVTDSHPQASKLAGDFLQVLSCAPVLASPFLNEQRAQPDVAASEGG